ncbi:MAG: hypothetical protein ACOY90_03225 [Candidatus Zhuqueibacterota bacterium]
MTRPCAGEGFAPAGAVGILNKKKRGKSSIAPLYRFIETIIT